MDLSFEGSSPSILILDREIIGDDLRLESDWRLNTLGFEYSAIRYLENKAVRDCHRLENEWTFGLRFEYAVFRFGISTLQGRAFFAKEVVPNKHLGQYQDIPFMAS